MLNARWAALPVIAGCAVAIGGLALIAPTHAWAKKGAIERLVEKEYASSIIKIALCMARPSQNSGQYSSMRI
jgi:hypothetical protein